MWHTERSFSVFVELEEMGVNMAKGTWSCTRVWGAERSKKMDFIPESPERMPTLTLRSEAHLDLTFT